MDARIFRKKYDVFMNITTFLRDFPYECFSINVFYRFCYLTVMCSSYLEEQECFIKI